MLALILAAALDLWPGFDIKTIPVASYDGKRTLLRHHPSPPEGFTPIGDGVFAYEGRHPAMTANSSVTIGGVETATVLKDSPALIAHETFHAYQRTRHPKWSANEADLFVYPVADADALALQRLELEALRRALASSERHRLGGWPGGVLAAGGESRRGTPAGQPARTPALGQSRCWARVAMSFRRERFAKIGASAAAYERGTELNEGLATYVEHRVSEARPVLNDGLPEGVRKRAYQTGHALALLLDRFEPRWRESLERDDTRTLDELLETALGLTTKGRGRPARASVSDSAGKMPAPPVSGQRKACPFSGKERGAIESRAAADARGVDARRAEQKREFLTQPGWTITITAEAPFFPERFDPLNVHVVAKGEVLHTRFVKLSGKAGSLEILGRQALTEAAGAHPLFNGVRRIVLTGVTTEPLVVENGGVTTIRLDGFTAELRGASVTTVHRSLESAP